jgi:hypothetical protein
MCAAVPSARCKKNRVLDKKGLDFQRPTKGGSRRNAGNFRPLVTIAPAVYVRFQGILGEGFAQKS